MSTIDMNVVYWVIGALIVMVLALLIRVWGLGVIAPYVIGDLECVGMGGIKQDGVDRTINAVGGIVMRVIGRRVSGSLEVVAKAAETLAYLDGGAT